MINYNNAYYPLNTIAYTVDGNRVGTAIIDIWGLYNPDNPDNAFRRGNPLDDSIYIWSIGTGATAGTNACISIDVSSTLSVEMKTDNTSNPAKVAVCAYNYGFDGQAGNNDRGFRVDPKTRLAYDITDTVSDYGGWQKSCLLCDINPLKWCVYPQIYIYTFPAGTGTFKTLDNMVAYINDNPENRKVSIIRPHLYRGDETRTADPKMWDDNGSQISEYPSVALLKDRPICDNLASSVGNYIRGHNSGNPDDVHDEYDISKVYNPFNQAMTSFWFRNSSARIETNERQMDIGYALQISKTNIISGYANVPNNGKCTAIWAHINTNIHDFSDVTYQWRNIIYDTVSQRELNAGFDVSTLTSGALRFAAVLEILDKKNYATKGEAYKAAVLHELAYWGFWIAETEAKAQTDPLGTTTTGAGIYLPEKIGGVTTGYYFTGDAIKDVPYAGATDTSPFEYKPEETNSDTGDLSTQLHSDSLAGSAQWYALTPLDMYFISQWLNTTYKPDTSVLSEDFKGVNPSDYIISVKYYPFDVPAGSATPLSIGGVPVEVNNVGISPYLHNRAYGEGSNSYYDLGSFALRPPYIYGDFRDEYTKMVLYIPWCGFVNLDSKLFMQSPDGAYHSIKCALSIDYATGAALGMVYRDNRLIETVNGTVGVDIPLSAVANGTYQNAIKSTEIALKNAKSQQISSALSMGAALVGGIASAATGNVVGVGASITAFAGSALKNEQINNTIENLKYQLTHTAPSVGDISSASPFNGALSEQTAKLLIFRAAMLPEYDAQKYARTTGHACCKQGILSEISRGYTECAGADLSGISATASEKNMIFDALKGGVII